MRSPLCVDETDHSSWLFKPALRMTSQTALERDLFFRGPQAPIFHNPLVNKGLREFLHLVDLGVLRDRTWGIIRTISFCINIIRK